jgi:hypothetical protein
MVSLMTSSWYTKEEAPIRMAIWHAGNIASNIFSGLLAAGVLTNMDGVANLPAWAWFFIIEGVVGAALGIFAFWGIPNFPHDHGVKWISPEQGELAQYRMLVSAGGRTEDDDGGAWEGVVLACKDPFTWIFTVLHFGLILALSYKDFFPSIVATLGYSDLMTYLIQAPPYVFAYIATVGISWTAGKYMEHCYHIIGTAVMGIVGTVIVISTLNPSARYFGMFYMCACPFVGLNIHIPWETTNVFTPRTKRGALVAITNCIASVSHWFSPYFFVRHPPSHSGSLLVLTTPASISRAALLEWRRTPNRWLRDGNHRCSSLQMVLSVLGTSSPFSAYTLASHGTDQPIQNKKLTKHEEANNLPRGWRYVE